MLVAKGLLNLGMEYGELRRCARQAYGVFKSATHDFFYGCTLLDGSTIGLTNRTTSLPMTLMFTDTGKKDLEFTENSTITVGELDDQGEE